MEVALVIASAIGAFTLNGYAHLEKYYLTLDVPIDRLNFSAQKLGAYGGAGLGSYVVAVVFAIALVAACTMLLLFLEKPRKEPVTPMKIPGWLARFRDRALELSLAMKFVAVIFIASFFLGIAWYLLVQVPSQSGRAAALKTAAQCKERDVVYQNLDRFEGCKVAESDDMVYLLKRTHADPSGVGFYTVELPKAGLRRIQSAEYFIEYKN